MDTDSFLAPSELKVEIPEYLALVHVLGLLEAGALEYHEDFLKRSKEKRLFNMSQTGNICGTPACIGGWVARFLGLPPENYLGEFGTRGLRYGHLLSELYWNDRAIDEHAHVSTKEAARALRNFLTTGAPDWDNVLDARDKA